MGQRIEDYGVIGDLHTMALVGRDGSIDWLCLPRFDSGHIVPWVRRHGERPSAIAGPDAVWLDTPVAVQGEHQATVAEFAVAAGDLACTERFWTDWVAQGDYSGQWPEAVTRSLVLLKALTYAATGGIVAAATTSLPEQLGGARNWDYRYCWLRDATFTLQALLGTGYVQEAGAWRHWLLRTVAGDPADLQIMYGIDGARRLTELELDWLPGDEGSRPVRIGNAAVAQLQLDVWGEVLDGLHVVRSSGLSPVAEAWDLQQAPVEHLEGRWREPDNSLWEVRGQRRHFVHPKVMAWVGLDRAVRGVDRFGLCGPVERWRSLCQEIHDEVCARGYDAERGTFTQSYGSAGLDAALLLIPRVGFLPWNDERVAGTVDAVRRELVEDGFVLRYRPGADGGVGGLPGGEGAFLAGSFWLADALQGIGRTAEARDLFERLLGLRNDLGILAEEYDPVSGRHLGNTPQAFSHVGLVNTAWHLSGPLPAADVVDLAGEAGG